MTTLKSSIFVMTITSSQAFLYPGLYVCFVKQIEEDAYQEDLGFTTGQLGKGGVAGPVRGPAVDKKTQVSISKRLQVKHTESCLFLV